MKVALFNNSVCVFVKERDREIDRDRQKQREVGEGGRRKERGLKQREERGREKRRLTHYT